MQLLKEQRVGREKLQDVQETDVWLEQQILFVKICTYPGEIPSDLGHVTATSGHVTGEWSHRRSISHTQQRKKSRMGLGTSRSGANPYIPVHSLHHVRY